MDQMSWKTKRLVEDGASPNPVLRQKSHRKLLSGLKLFKTVRADGGRDTGTDDRKNRRAEVSDDENAQIYQQQEDLPHDLITFQILTRLPIKSLLQFKSVSKEWYCTISSYAFAKARFRADVSSYNASSPIEWLFIQAENNYYLLFYEEEDAVLDYSLVKLEIDLNDEHKNEIQVVGSCNGLVCLAYTSRVENYFYIWNPITHNYCKYPDPYLLSTNYQTSWGFAYVSSQDDYKVVRLIQDFNTLQLIVHVFSLRTQNWKRVHDHGLGQSISLSKPNPGVLAGETLYWFMDTRGPSTNPMGVGFNLALDKFEKVLDLVPRSISPWNQSLCAMGGSLSLYGLTMQDEVYVSILKKPGQLDSICLPPELGPRFCSGLVGFTKAGRFFLVSKNSEVALIDPNSSCTQYTPLITFKKARRPSISRFVPSLVSPLSISESYKHY